MYFKVRVDSAVDIVQKSCMWRLPCVMSQTKMHMVVFIPCHLLRLRHLYVCDLSRVDCKHWRIQMGAQGAWASSLKILT